MARGILGHTAHRAWSLFRWRILPQLGHEIMRHRSPQQMVSQWPEGEIPLGPKVCVFVHWDGAGEVRDHVMHHIRGLADVGISVVFVTNAGFLRPAAIEALKLVCAGIIIRRNVGYDFGAWREGFERLNLPRPNTTLVAMANDSVYGPIRSLNHLFGTIDFDVADIWGCTDSWQSRYHLQSYLIAFSPKVVASETWRTFWQGVVPTWSKMWLIRLYEIGLTQTLLKSGYTMRAVWPYKDLIQNIDVELLDDRPEEEDEDDEKRGTKAPAAENGVEQNDQPKRKMKPKPNLGDPVMMNRRRHVLRLREAVAGRQPLNPTSDLWRQLLTTNFPFIKRELLRDNPSKVPDVMEWRDAVKEISERVLAPIERDLQRTLKDRTP